MSVKIICDSACDMTRAEASAKDITLLPLKTLIDGKEYRDGVDIDGAGFYKMLAECKTLPTTSQIGPSEFLNAYNEAGKENEIVVLSMSGDLSGTAQSARIAAMEFDGEVYCVDTLNITAGERVLLEYAIRLRDEGRSGREIADELEKAKEKVCIVARVDTLEYLKKGGRLGKLAAIAGTVLNVKPVLGMVNGEIKILGKARGVKQSNNMLTDIIKKRGVDFSMPIMLAYSGSDRSLLDSYVEYSRSLWEGKIDKLPDCIMGSTIGTHAGPGAVAVAFFEKNHQ